MSVRLARRAALLLGIVATAGAAWQALDLLDAWRHAPLDRLGWLAFAFWMIPAGVAAGVRGSAAPGRSTIALVLVPCAGLAGVHVVGHLALAIACWSWMPRRRLTLAWLAGAASWMPALGWVAGAAGDNAVCALRLVLALAALVAGLRAARPVAEPREVPMEGAVLARRRLAGFAFSLLAAALCASWVFTPEARPLEDPALLPVAGQNFRSNEVPLSRTESDFFGSASVLKRRYRTASGDFTVQVIDGARNRHVVHDPLHCWRGGGWDVASEARLQVGDGHARALALERAGDRAGAVYWFSGYEPHASAPFLWASSVAHRLSFGRRGAPARLVLLTGEADADWPALLKAVEGLDGL